MSTPEQMRREAKSLQAQAAELQSGRSTDFNDDGGWDRIYDLEDEAARLLVNAERTERAINLEPAAKAGHAAARSENQSPLTGDEARRIAQERGWSVSDARLLPLVGEAEVLRRRTLRGQESA